MACSGRGGEVEEEEQEESDDDIMVISIEGSVGCLGEKPLLHSTYGGGTMKPTVYDHSFCLLISAETSS